MKRAISLLLIVGVLSLALSPVAVAQVTGGTISGTIRNQAQEPLVGVKITALNTATNQTRVTATDEDGVYRLPALAVGRYEITMEADTYQKRVQQVTLRVNEEARVDVEMVAVGSSEEATIVATSAPLTESSSSVLGIVIDNKQIMQLPINGRNFLQLGALVANVNSTPTLRSGAEGGARNGPFAVAGQRDRSLSFLVDGVDNTNSLHDSLSARFSVDSIQEFKMITSLGSAEYGYHSGGTINIITRSGSNDLHFSLFEFFRNDKLNAANHFEKLAGREAANFSNNQFGGVIGAPIVKDKLFFLANYEGQRLRAGTPQFASVPTLAERAGRFTNPFTGQPVQLPVHPVSAEILRRYIPEPNVESEFGNFFSAATQRSRSHFALFKMDYLLSGDDLINVRYHVYDSHTLYPINPEHTGFGSMPVIPGFGLVEDTRTQNIAVSYTHNFSAQTINDLRFGFNNYFLDQLHENTDRPADVGFVGVENVRGLPFTIISGISSFGNLAYPVISEFGNYHISNSLAFTKGRHALKVGGEARVLRQYESAFSSDMSLLFFAGFATGISPLADFVSGSTFGATVYNRPYASPLNHTVWGFFLQDDYQVNRRLVLNLGLRYELATVLKSPTAELTNYSFTRGLFTPGRDTDTELYKGDHNNFAPRFGFAYSLTGDGRTVLRGGYGIFYDTIVHTIGVDMNQNDPTRPFNSRNLTPFAPGNLARLLDRTNLLPLSGLSNAYDENLRTPYAQHFNLTLQREVGKNMVVSLGYVGSKGTKIVLTRDINQAFFIPGVDANGQPRSTFFNTDARRPSQLFKLTPTPVGSIRQFETGASSTYHAFQTTVNKRLSRGLSVLGAYTWSKSLDNASDPFGYAGDTGLPQNSHDLNAERGRSAFDLAHQMTVGATYELPFLGNRWLEGWQVHSIVTMKTGQPFTPVLGMDTSLTGTFAARPNYDPQAFQVKDGQVFINRNLPLDPVSRLPLSVIPQTGQFGNLGRNVFTGPGYKNVDLSVVKQTRVNERLALQTRVEVFNIFNTTNLAQPERRMNEPLFGRSSRTQDVAGGAPGIGGGGPRVMQIALRLVY